MTVSPSFPRPVADKIDAITAEPIDLVGLLARSHDPRAGALVLFSGDVRDHNAGKEVDRLEYEAHPVLAPQMIEAIVAEAQERWSLTLAVAQHRIGKVGIGESAVVVITASPHRKEAYAANRYIIDKIKHEVPIWKCEYFADGTRQWGNNCNCSSITGKNDKHVYEFERESK
ncbi:molybdenum cofactor biosynthesis protein MoaE [Paraflavisolibacter sp. H34]|uniref:molybdenum cofactor biosynthesis protein MoaE n=1 Tax=Huijunlia imazamoxiresistens TaxID=3127457 RepID=UPI003016D758